MTVFFLHESATLPRLALSYNLTHDEVGNMRIYSEPLFRKNVLIATFSSQTVGLKAENSLRE